MSNPSSSLQGTAAILASFAAGQPRLAPLPEPNQARALENDLIGSAWVLPAYVEDGDGRESTILRFAGSLRATGTPQKDIEAAALEYNCLKIHPPLEEDIVLDRARRYATAIAHSAVVSQTGLPVNPTDNALSEVFVTAQGSEFKYDHSLRGWRHYQNGTWGVCRMSEQVEAMKRCVPHILGEAAMEMAKDPESLKGKKLQALALRAQNEHGISAALKLAQSAPALAITSDKFDRNPDQFNVANGVIDLVHQTLVPHDPAMLLSKRSLISYNPQAVCPTFIQFMDQISCGDPDWVDYLQRQLGYILSGRVYEEKLFFWFGDGRNGKSVLANVVQHIMGDYATTSPVSMFMTSRRDGADATPHLAELPGRRLALANETEAGARMSAQMLKVAVSTEKISARHLHGNPFSFAPTHKFIMRGNHLPILHESDEGTWRRIDLVPFDLKLTPSQADPDLERKLIAEAPGVLRWLVEGHAKWRQSGLSPCARVQAASNNYRKASDVIANWIADECAVHPQNEVETVQAFHNFGNWAASAGLKNWSKPTFTRSLTQKGFQVGRQSTGNRKEIYKGFKLK
jgi:putative DNA primase/helicase